MLVLLMFCETRGENPKKYFRVLSCVIYTIIDDYICIYYPACHLKRLSETSVSSKHVDF